MNKITTFPGWENVGKLGAGSFGTVYEIQRTVNGVIERSALKVLSVPESPDEVQDIYDRGIAEDEEGATTYIESQVKSISQEFMVMEKLKDCQNVVRLQECKVIPHDGWIGSDILIRMELLTPLSRYMKTHELTEKEIVKIGIDICSALEACQNEKPPILHRDIKIANIMVDDQGTFKLGDFGVARAMEGTKSAHTKAGTEDYMAPEVTKGQGYFATADIYSLGILLYRLLNKNRNPFLPTEGNLTEKLLLKAKTARLSGQPVLPPLYGSDELKNKILKALAYDKSQRYQTAMEFRWALESCTCIETSEEREDDFDEGQTIYSGNSEDHNEGTISSRQPRGNKEPKQNITEKKKNKKVIIIVVIVVILVILYCIGTYAEKKYSADYSGSTESSTNSASDASSDSATASTQDNTGRENTDTKTSSDSSVLDDNNITEIGILSSTDVLLVGDSTSCNIEAGDAILGGGSETISWSITNGEEYATVQNGVVTATSAGTFTLTAEYEGYQDSVDITAAETDANVDASLITDVDSISLQSFSSSDIMVGASFPEDYTCNIKAYVSPELFANLEWGTATDSGTSLTITDCGAGDGTSGTVTILLFDANDTTHILADKHIKVQIKDN